MPIVKYYLKPNINLIIWYSLIEYLVVGINYHSISAIYNSVFKKLYLPFHKLADPLLREDLFPEGTRQAARGRRQEAEEEERRQGEGQEEGQPGPAWDQAPSRPEPGQRRGSRRERGRGR